MEDRGKRKLLATTASCQGHEGRAVTKGLIDRLSNLPDHVAHHILSFLEITDLTCFGCVSKRCRELYLSTPSLKFDGFYCKHFETYDKRLRLWSYLDRYLCHRGVNEIQSFRIHWDVDPEDQESLYEDEKFRLFTWIYKVIRLNVQVLDIRIQMYSQTPPLPPCVLLCGSLKSLSVNMFGMILKAPSVASFSNLECLKLQDVVLLDEVLFEWISCSCKCIKELSLIHVYGKGPMHVTIESTSLESLIIERVDSIFHLNISGHKLRKIILNWNFGYCTDNPRADKLINICAPNLKSLNLTGSFRNQVNPGRLECLEEADICLLPDDDYSDDDNPDDDFVILSEVLCCLCSAKVLILNKEATMALFKGGSMPLLKNVCYLCIHIEGFLDILVPAMTSLLGGMSKLSTLIIKSDSFFRGPKADCRGFNMGYWKLQNTAFIYQLKEVSIELSHGSNGIEFARCILDHAQNLNKMTILHSPQQSNAMSKLKKSKMASNITLDFQEDQRRGPQKRRGRRVA